jgi:CheY-like chemotaxis protein
MSRTRFGLVSTGCETVDSCVTGLLLSTVPAMKSATASPVTILLVDENPNGLTARRMILEEQGFVVTTSTTAQSAWEIFQNARFDIVVTDYRHKGMSAGELIHLIRAANSPSRIILLSGFNESLGLTEESTGADELILKSNKEVPELVRAVRKLAHQSPRRKPASTATGLVSGRMRKSAKVAIQKAAGSQ